MALNERKKSSFFCCCFPFLKVYNICILRGCRIHQYNRSWTVVPAFNSRYFLASFSNSFAMAGELLKGDVPESPGQYIWYFWNCGETCNLSPSAWKGEVFCEPDPAENMCGGIAKGFRSLLACLRGKRGGVCTVHQKESMRTHIRKLV